MPMKMHGQKWELLKDHYEVIDSFRIPNERWNGMYQYAPE
jgi:hypothetical protein